MGNSEHTRGALIYYISKRQIFWTKLLIPNKVIDCIHVLDCRRKSEIGLTFVQRYGTVFIDELVDKLDRELDNEYLD